MKLIKTSRPGSDDVVRVTFVLPADEPAGAVSVVGDFNEWNPFAHPLRRRSNGTRSAVIKVQTGSRLHFRYLGEGGLWFDDEAADHRDASGAALAV
jgi:1,4-alpha-glucan branching enzyme